MAHLAQGRDVLPTYVKPKHYALSLEPNFETFKFEGSVKVDLDVNDSTSEILLNALDIDIHCAKIESNGQSQASSDITYNKKKQTVLLKFKDALKPKEAASLSLKFQGTLNDNMAGFYRSSYVDKEGMKRWLATTQMEPTDCRRAFPCWDEPALKATWEVEITADKELTVLSNMDVNKEKVNGGKKTTLFNPTPLMSSYLLAFVIGDLAYVETHTKNNVPVRVYATKGSEHLGKFSLELAAKTLDFFGTSFGSDYPLPKMDMVSIPDFSAGAMENWGLVTYRVVDLLLDEKTANAATKERVAEVVQHELAHQWFGNLVTMDFWDGLWLNEGFATWMSWYSCNKFFPEWKVWESYVTDNLQSALRLDGLRSSHPIEVPVKSAEEVNQIFDAISYSKGSCVIRMISQYIGEETFLKGIRLYLKRHAYGSTQTSDLWRALSEASGVDVESFADIWTKKIGYPVVKVQEDGDKISLTQNRYLTTGDTKPNEDTTLYWIPLGFKTLDKSGKAEISKETMNSRTYSLTIPSHSNDFFKINSNHSGIYRVAYSPERLQKLGRQAQEIKNALTVEDRAGLVADTGALSASGYIKTSSLLGLVQGWTGEGEYVVWDEMLARIESIQAAWMFEPRAVQDGLKSFARSLAGPKSKSLGWTFKEDEPHVLAQFKARLFSAACNFDDPEAVQEATSMFKKLVAGDKDAVHPNLRGAVFVTAVRIGGKEAWDHVHNIYLHPASTDEKYTALRSLGRSEDEEQIKKTLALSLSPEVKEQDIYMPYQGLRAHAKGVNALWNFATDNFQTLEKKLPPGLTMLSTVVSLVTNAFTTEDKLAEIRKFFSARDTTGYDRGLAQSLDSIRAKISWLGRDRSDVSKWLEQNKFSAPKL